MSKKLGYYFNNKKYNKNSYIANFNKEGIETIDNIDDEKELLRKLKESYKLQGFNKEELKQQLIFIENKKINLKKFNLTSIFTAAMSIGMSFVTAMIAIINTVNSIVISAQNKANVDAYKFLKDAKNTIETYGTLINYVAAVVFLFFLILAIFIINEILNNDKEVNIGIVANIHKSIIEEKLKEIEKEKLINEKEDKIEEDIEYLKEKISEYKYKTELLEDIFKVKVNGISR